MIERLCNQLNTKSIMTGPAQDLEWVWGAQAYLAKTVVLKGFLVQKKWALLAHSAQKLAIPPWGVSTRPQGVDRLRI